MSRGARGRGDHESLNRERARRRERGQGLVEFAISVPVVILMIAFGVDFGRVFLGWIQLSNAVREAANFAAINPDAFLVPGVLPAEYVRLINTETQGINCKLPPNQTPPGPMPGPTYPGGTDLGSPAVVAITCRFAVFTPIIANVLGNQVNVSASASFPVRAGAINGTPVGGTLPSFSTTTTTTTTSTTTTGTTTTATTTTTTGPTPVPDCVVPNLKNVNSSAATAIWTGAGFTASNLGFNPLVPPHYTIKNQSLTKNSSVPCTSSMTVTP